MEFKDFLKHIPNITKVSLPAEEAHVKMMPKNRREELRNIDIKNCNPKNAAVMMLFYPKHNETTIVLIIRASHTGVHSSQIAFPGGKEEPEDNSLVRTALRETEEEIGVQTKNIEVIRKFTEVYIPPSNFLVTPFLGITDKQPNFILQEEEVAGIVEIPLNLLFNNNILVNRKLKTSYASEIDVPAFLVNNHIVWGATAMMINELKETLLNSIK